MMLLGLTIAVLATTSTAAPQTAPTPPKFPVSGENGEQGGVFGFGPKGLVLPGQAPGSPPKIPAMTAGPEAPKTMNRDDKSPGTGPYQARWREDPTLPNHTVYAPNVPPPKGVKMPVIVWANGGCGNTGTGFQNLLREIASHGYLILANGPPAVPSNGTSVPGFPKGFGGGTPSSIKQMTDGVDWVMKGSAAKYGDIDTSKIAAAGQSCGGLQAYSASYHDDRIKLTILFNSGVTEESKVYLLKELKAPVGYFIGGPLDVAYKNAERDWVNLPPQLPAVKLNLDSGHGGTFGAPNAGKFGVASVAFLNWVFKDDMKAKALFFDKDSQLIKDKWNITAKNW